LVARRDANINAVAEECLSNRTPDAFGSAGYDCYSAVESHQILRKKIIL